MYELFSFAVSVAEGLFSVLLIDIFSHLSAPQWQVASGYRMYAQEQCIITPCSGMISQVKYRVSHHPNVICTPHK
jgi:hypothetical protein